MCQYGTAMGRFGAAKGRRRGASAIFSCEVDGHDLRNEGFDAADALGVGRMGAEPYGGARLRGAGLCHAFPELEGFAGVVAGLSHVS